MIDARTGSAAAYDQHDAELPSIFLSITIVIWFQQRTNTQFFYALSYAFDRTKWQSCLLEQEKYLK